MSSALYKRIRTLVVLDDIKWCRITTHVTLAKRSHSALSQSYQPLSQPLP